MTTDNIERVEANLVAARPALDAIVEACERLVQALDLDNSYDRQYAVQRESTAVQTALAELEPHQSTLPYLHASVPNLARSVVFHASRRNTEAYQADLARQATTRIRGIIGN